MRNDESSRAKQSNLMTTETAFQSCLNPRHRHSYGVDQALTACPETGDLLDIQYDWDRVAVPGSLREFEARWTDRRNPLNFSGVWRFHDLLPFAPLEKCVTVGEGQTLLQPSDGVASTSASSRAGSSCNTRA
jgi:threonine synthase